MPIYEYKCVEGHTFEVIQAMSDDPVEVCEECGAPVERVFHPVAVHFKGSGFYSTDYAGKGKDGDSKDGASKDGDSGSDAKSDSGDSKRSDSSEGKKSESQDKKAKTTSNED